MKFLALSSAFYISGCTLTATPSADGSANVNITADPAQVAQVQGQLQGLLGQVSGQLPTDPSQIGQFPPLAPTTDPNAGGLPSLPPLAAGAAGTTVAGAPGTTVAGANVPTSNAPASVPTAPAVAAPAATAPAATAPAAPTNTLAAAGSTSLGATAQSISNQFGVSLTGYPDAQGLANLNTALALYPSGAVRGATINFTGQNAGSLGGTWQTGGLVTLYQTGVHVCAHELAHHIVEQNRARWGAQLKQYLAYDLGDFPQSAYAVKSAQSGNFEEVAAETVSYYAEGRWKPSNPQLEALLKAMITNQPGATAYHAPHTTLRFSRTA